MVDDYTRLLETVAELEDDAAAEVAVKKLVAHLKSEGRLRLLPQIARELKKISARRAALLPQLEVANQKELAAARSAAAQMGIVVSNPRINSSLVHGWRAQKNGTLIDRSAKRALLRLYQNITA